MEKVNVADPTISLCLIGKNELGFFLKEVLDSATFVDEIIYVDTGSTDGTLEFLEKNYPDVKVYHSEFNSPQDYTTAKNEALEHATMDYILSTDCDEVFDENANQIKQFLKEYPENKIWCLLGEHYMGDLVHMDRVTNTHIWQNRLFKNDPEIRYPESCMHGLPDIGKKIIINVKCIHHYGFAKNMCDALRRFETNKNDPTQNRDDFLWWQFNVMLTGRHPGQPIECYPEAYYYQQLMNHPKSIIKKFHIEELIKVRNG